MNNPILLNALADDAKHVLSLANLRKCRDPSDRSRSLIIHLYLSHCHLLHNLHSLENVLRRRNVQGDRLGDRFREHLRDIEKDDQNPSKPVARHINLSNHSKHHIAVCDVSLHQRSTETRKTLKNLFFKSALLVLTVLTSAFHSTNLFICFSRYQAPANSITPYFCI